jgi:hydrophobic/amphiphilic exporter-1 (mainly G- bacteria), HAE1 family
MNRNPSEPVGERINPIARFAVERRVTMGMIVLGVLVLGGVSLTRLPLEFLPSFSSSSIWVWAPYASSSPQETERRIVRPLEDSLGTINGVETLSARASADSGNVSLTFLDGTDMDLAAVDVRDRVDRVRHLLPPDLRRVFVRRFQSEDLPVLRFHLSAPWPKDRLQDFVERVVQRRIERLDGVAQVEVHGLQIAQVRVDLVPGRLQAHGLDVRQIAETLRGANVTLSGGYIEEGSRRFLVRTLGEYESLDEIRDQPLGGSGLRLGDVAQVSYSYPRQEEFNFLNGREALTVRVYKASTANLLAVADRVKAELSAIQGLAEARGLEARVYRDSSVDVRQGLGQLRNAGLVGGFLAVAFLFFFLRKLRTTLLIALAIPISVVFTFAILFLMRQSGLSTITLNIMSLMGLVLALGMLVDNSVVVIESIYRHVQDLGEDGRTAALRGTSEVALPIIASTATTICVFVPLLFLASSGGGFMRFLTDLGVTVCVVMVASLLVALTVVPMVAASLLAGETKRKARLVEWMGITYGRTIAFTLRHRPAFLGSILMMLWGSWALFSGIERSFASGSLERQIRINVDTPRNYSLEQTAAVFERVRGLIDARRDELEVEDIVYEYDRSSGRARGGGGGRRFEVFLRDEAVSHRSTREIQDEIRTLLPVEAGVEFRIAQARGRRGDSGISLEVRGDDMAVLELVARNVAGALERLPWVKDVDTSLDSGDEEIHVRVRQARAQQSGVSSGAVAATVASALSSRPVSHMKSDEREVDIVVQFREEDRRTLGQLKTLPMETAAGKPPIGALADFTIARGARTIERENKRSEIDVNANTTRAATSFRMMDEVRGIVDSIRLPPGYEWEFGRWTRFAARDFEGAEFALLLALLLVYLIMAALFESFTQPLTIMLSIPFAFLGVGVALRFANQPLDNNANLGLVILLGVVVNNAIVLVDHINHLRSQGVPREEAIVLGGRHRLRPILMTALTTILGLLPMVAPLLFPGWLGQPEGRAANWAPIGLVILGGLTTSTFLTLMIIPTFYSLVDDLTRFFGRVAREA